MSMREFLGQRSMAYANICICSLVDSSSSSRQWTFMCFLERGFGGRGGISSVGYCQNLAYLAGFSSYLSQL